MILIKKLAKKKINLYSMLFIFLFIISSSLLILWLILISNQLNKQSSILKTVDLLVLDLHNDWQKKETIKANLNEKNEHDCSEKESTLEIKLCLNEEYMKTQEELANILEEKNYAKNSTGTNTEILRNSQEIWEKYRNITCNQGIASKWEGGSAQGAAILNCEIILTKERINILQHF